MAFPCNDKTVAPTTTTTSFYRNKSGTSSILFLLHHQVIISLLAWLPASILIVRSCKTTMLEVAFSWITMPNLLHGLWHIKISTNRTRREERGPAKMRMRMPGTGTMTVGGSADADADDDDAMVGGHWWRWSKNLINIWTEWDRRHTATTIPRLLCLESATTQRATKLIKLIGWWRRMEGIPGKRRGEGFGNWCKSKISEKLQWLALDPGYYRHHLI